MANDSVVTQNTLQTFYNNKVYPYLNGATHTGCVPLGTVLPYYGETAPEHFLICDGTEYLKSDYGELATHLLSLTDPTPYQGSDSDHFKVPDLRGEFLRGKGTNGHTNQGNGGNVGEHQDATDIPNIWAANSGKNLYWGTTGTTAPANQDSTHTSTKQGCTPNGTYFSDRSATQFYTSRPTNTSVTYIIAYQNAYIDLALDGFPIDITQPQDGQLLMYDATAGRWVNGGHKYSTDEHIVGTWIDGKPLYELNLEGTSPNSVGTEGTIALLPSNADLIFISDGYLKASDNEYLPLNWDYLGTYMVTTHIDKRYGVRMILKGGYNNKPVKIVIKYTKTTDTV